RRTRELGRVPPAPHHRLIEALPCQPSGCYARTVNRLQQRVEKLGGILDVAKALVAERDLDRLLKLIVHAAARVVEADRCSLFLVDRERGELWTKVAQGIGTKESRLPIDQGSAGAV